MRTKFPGNFRPSEEEFKELWNTAIFSFDANILLNLYRFTKETRDDFMNFLDKNKDNIWLTHQATHEYLNNRIRVNKDCKELYQIVKTDTKKQFKDIKNKFKNTYMHPFIKESTKKELDELSDKIDSELDNRAKERTKSLDDYDINEEIVTIFSNKVGSEYDKTELINICKEGEERYKLEIPPGFNDDKKANNKYGDFIIWKQLMDKSKTDNKDIIFITNDSKSDWWQISKKPTNSPRPELINEFHSVTNNNIYIYNEVDFIKSAKKYLQFQFNEKTIEEMKSVSDYSSILDSFLVRDHIEREIFNLENSLKALTNIDNPLDFAYSGMPYTGYSGIPTEGNTVKSRTIRKNMIIKMNEKIDLNNELTKITDELLSIQHIDDYKITSSEIMDLHREREKELLNHKFHIEEAIAQLRIAIKMDRDLLGE